MRLVSLVRTELCKMFRQRGTYAGFILLGVFIGLLVWGVWAEGPPMGDVGHRFGNDFAVGGKTISGPSMPYFLLQIPPAVDVFLPLLISMIAGGIIASEAQRGTLRTLLTRPVHRWAVVVGKLVAAFTHAAAIVLFMGLFSLALGYVVFGRGDLIVMEKGLRIFAEPQALGRLGIAYGLTVVTMFSVAALALFCSTIFEHPLTASGVTVGFLIVSAALMVIPAFDWLQPYLLTSHFHGFKKVFGSAIDWQIIGIDLYYVVEYTLLAIAGTLMVFCRKDMTC